MRFGCCVIGDFVTIGTWHAQSTRQADAVILARFRLATVECLGSRSKMPLNCRAN